MKTPSLLCTIALSGVLSLGVPAWSFADGDPIVITLPIGTTFGGGGLTFDPNYTYNGSFRSSDGTSGTFVETRTYVANSTGVGGVDSHTTVFTLADKSATSTDTTTTTFNTDGSNTVTYSHLGFGAATAFTSTTTYAFVTSTRTRVNGDAVTSSGASVYGTGTFTAADGTSGTLTSVRTNAPSSFVTSTDYANTANGLTRETRVDQLNGIRTIIKVVSVNPAGVATTTIRTLTRVGHSHH